jgi:hypothetical protein
VVHLREKARLTNFNLGVKAQDSLLRDGTAGREVPNAVQHTLSVRHHHHQLHVLNSLVVREETEEYKKNISYR